MPTATSKQLSDTPSVAARDAPILHVAAQRSALDALYLVNCLGIGGSERKVVRLVNRLRARGTAAAVAYLNTPETLVPMLQSDVPRWHLDRRGKFSVPALRRLTALIEEFRPRVLFAVNLYPALYALGAAMSLRGRAPALASLVNTTHMGRREEWRKLLYKRVLRRFDCVVYGCAAQRSLWLDRADSAWSRSSIIYNGVDLDEFGAGAGNDGVRTPRPGRDYGPDTFVIGSVGRLTETKNQRVLVDSLAALRAGGLDARLILVGDGPLRGELERRAARAGVEPAVDFTGNLADVRPVLAAMDVFVLPSLSETFSNAALEAMAMSRPVVLSAVGGAVEMIRDGTDGFVIAHRDLPTRLPQVLRQLAVDRAARARIGLAARERVETSFSFDAMVTRYEQLIAGARHGHGR